MAIVEAELVRQLAVQAVIEQHELGTAAAIAHAKMIRYSGKREKESGDVVKLKPRSSENRT